jgi:adenylate cyclase
VHRYTGITDKVVFVKAQSTFMTMQVEQLSIEQLRLEIEKLRQEVKDLKQDKVDLELLLETTTAHADTIAVQLYESNRQLQAEIVERQRTESVLQTLTLELQSILTIVSRDKADLEILLETTTEHGDTVEGLLFDKAEEVVRQSEKRLAKFLDAVPVGVGILNATGQPCYSNLRARQLLGQEGTIGALAQELTKTYRICIAGTEQLYPHDKLPGVRALRGEKVTVDNLEIHLNDRIIPIEAWGTPIFDENGKIVYAIVAFQDITERKQAEAESKKFTHELYELNEAYERFVPRQFLQYLNKDSIVDVQLGDHVQQEMSVLFADIRDFTTLSEQLTPQENFKFINAFFSRMEPAVIENQGFIDKYIGDEIMALFSGGADNAVRAGIAMQRRLADYNIQRTRSGYMPLKMGIGINTGSLMLGTVGGLSRMDSTVISDAVNLGSRLERLTKSYGVSMIISHHTFLQLDDPTEYAFRVIDRVRVKGKLKAVSVYELFDAEAPEIREGKLATKREFEQAVLLYNQNHLAEAAALFEHCLLLNPNDTVAQIYRLRCQPRTSGK